MTTRYDRMRSAVRAAWSNFLAFRPSSSPIPQSRSTSLDLEACDLRADHIRDEQAAEIASKAAEIERLREEAKLANDGWHMANGVADLAMKHRDMAEKQLAAIMGKLTDWRAELEWGSPLRVRDEIIAIVNDVSTDEFAAVDAGPTPLRGRITRRTT